MNTLIIYISDIHFTGTRPENEGVVINAFLKDVKKQLGEMPHKDVFLFIGGDLVQKADDKDSYDRFWNDVISCSSHTSGPSSSVSPWRCCTT